MQYKYEILFDAKTGLYSTVYIKKNRWHIISNIDKNALIDNIDKLLNADFKDFSKEEIDIIREYYVNGGAKECQKYLPNRSLKSIIHQANVNKISINKSWTKDEIELLKQYYPIEGENCVKRFPNRTVHSIKGKAKCLHIQAIRKTPYTEKELDIIRKYYPIEGEKCAVRLPGRNPKCIAKKASNLKIAGPKNTAWTKDEIELLKQYYPKYGIQYCMELLHKSYSQITNKVSRLKLYKDTCWTDEEISILKQYYPTEGSKCANRLEHRSKGSVRNKAIHLGVSYKYDDNNLEIINEYISGKISLMETAAKLNISPNKVITIVNKLKKEEKDNEMD